MIQTITSQKYQKDKILKLFIFSLVQVLKTASCITYAIQTWRVPFLRILKIRRGQGHLFVEISIKKTVLIYSKSYPFQTRRTGKVENINIILFTAVLLKVWSSNLCPFLTSLLLICDQINIKRVSARSFYSNMVLL